MPCVGIKGGASYWGPNRRRFTQAVVINHQYDPSLRVRLVGVVVLSVGFGANRDLNGPLARPAATWTILLRLLLRPALTTTWPMPLLTTSNRYVGDSRTTDPDGGSFSDDGESVPDEFLTITPDGRMTRLNDYFTASLGGRVAIRNSMVRGDLHSRRPSATKKPKTYLADARLRTVVAIERANNGESSSASTNHFCRRGCPFGRACHKRVITPVCMACFGVVRSGDRAAVKSEGPPVVMNGGFATH